VITLFNEEATSTPLALQKCAFKSSEKIEIVVDFINIF